MGTLSAIEQARFDMFPIWQRLDAVVAHTEAGTAYVKAKVAGHGFDAAGFTAAFRAANEFDKTWPHFPLPDIFDLVHADAEGRLQEKVAQLNAEFHARVE